jgi:hypothetical protein
MADPIVVTEGVRVPASALTVNKEPASGNSAQDNDSVAEG